MQRSIPPFRADHVGSILRTAAIKEARLQKAAGKIDAAQLKAIEDAEIRKIIAKQEEVGLQSVTDGEFRRAWWHYDFLSQLDGVEIRQVEGGIKFAGVTTKAEAPYVYGKLGSKSHPQIEHFKFVKENTKRTPKMTIPSPSMLHYRGGSKMIDRSVYPSMDDFWTDLGRAYAQAIKGFYDAGIFASLYDVVPPRSRATAAGLMNTVGWGLGSLGPLLTGWYSDHGPHGSKVENMSHFIAYSGGAYVVGGAVLLLAGLHFVRRDFAGGGTRTAGH